MLEQAGKHVGEVMLHADARQAELRTATLYYKPGCSEVDMRPDFFLKTVAPETWLVFPHELDGLSHEELAQKKPLSQPPATDE